MRIRQLHINRFGHFNECDLAFRGDGLQVVYGPNEAGKTTLLEFLRGLLFDFPARTPYDFGGQGEMAGVAMLELRDGRTVELRRRKGNKDKVAIKIDGQPTGFADADWLRLLDHADRGLFESVFAFGLDELSQGEASLVHESVQSALFGGSLGGIISPDKVIADLSRQADEIFKKGGSKPAINVLLADIKRLTKEINSRLLRPAKYQEAEAAAAAAAAHAHALHAKVDRLRCEHAQIEKQVRAWPKWWELRQRRSERAGLKGTGGSDVAKNIPADARQCYLAIRQELESLSVELAKRADAIRKAEKSLAELTLDPEAIAHRAHIKSCLELRQSYIDAKKQLPERQWKREEMRQQIDRELSELRPGWSHDDLRAFSVDVAARSQIERLSDESGQRATARTTLTAKRDVDAASLSLAREELAEIGAPREVTTLDTALADEADYAANRKRLESLSGELAKLERKLAAQSRRLTPPAGAVTPAPQDLPVPRAETVAEFQVGFTKLFQELQTARASADEDEAEQRELERTLAAAMSNHAVPQLAQRDAARARRDAGWRLVLQKYILLEPVDSAIAEWLEDDVLASLPNAYERAVSNADEIADRIYDNASEVAQRESLRRQLATLVTRLGQKRQRVVQLEQQHAELQSQWRALWDPCGFEPLTADAMLAWLNDHQAVCATTAHRDDLLADKSRLDTRCALFEQQLRTACGVVDGDVSVLLVCAIASINSSTAF